MFDFDFLCFLKWRLILNLFQTIYRKLTSLYGGLMTSESFIRKYLLWQHLFTLSHKVFSMWRNFRMSHAKIANLRVIHEKTGFSLIFKELLIEQCLNNLYRPIESMLNVYPNDMLYDIGSISSQVKKRTQWTHPRPITQNFPMISGRESIKVYKNFLNYHITSRDERVMRL